LRESLGVDADWKRTDLYPAAVDLAPIAAGGSPGVGAGDAIAEIIGVGLGLKTNDIIGANPLIGPFPLIMSKPETGFHRLCLV
jgi:hypothetical protein